MAYTQGSSVSVGGTEAMQTEAWTSFTESEQFRQLLGSVVNGTIRGSLPTGFLSQMQDLPIEILVKIWSYLSANERRGLRQVCKYWKAIWESTKQKKKKFSALHFQLTGSKLSIKAEDYSSEPVCIQIETKESHIKQALSLIELGYAAKISRFIRGSLYVEHGRILFDNETGNSDILRAVAAQNWQFGAIAFKGKHSLLTEGLLLNFFEGIRRSQGDKFGLIFHEMELIPNVITDRTVEACADLIHTFIVTLGSNCVNRNSVALTDSSLEHLLKRLVTMVVIPPSSDITVNGISSALQGFFRAGLERNSAVAFRQAPSLHIGLTETVTATKISGIKLEFEKMVISRDEVFDPEERGESKDNGTVTFSVMTGVTSDNAISCDVHITSEKMLWYYGKSYMESEIRLPSPYPYDMYDHWSSDGEYDMVDEFEEEEDDEFVDDDTDDANDIYDPNS